MVGDARAAVRAEARDHALDQFVAFVPGEVHVYVRRILPRHVEESFEVELVRDGIHVGDRQREGDDGGGARAAAAGPAGHGDDVVHHEEVGRKAFALDDVQLVVYPLRDRVGQFPVALLGTVEDAPPQRRRRIYLIRSRIRRIRSRIYWIRRFRSVTRSVAGEDEAVEDRVEAAGIGDLVRRPEGLGP